MTKISKALIACNVLTLVFSAGACYFAFEAKQEALSAGFSAEWGSQNAAGELSEIRQSLVKVKEVTDRLKAEHDIEEKFRLPPAYR